MIPHHLYGGGAGRGGGGGRGRGKGGGGGAWVESMKLLLIPQQTIDVVSVEN